MAVRGPRRRLAATIALVVPTSKDRDERDTFEYDIGR
jgi:hypothetical protein